MTNLSTPIMVINHHFDVNYTASRGPDDYTYRTHLADYMPLSATDLELIKVMHCHWYYTRGDNTASDAIWYDTSPPRKGGISPVLRYVQKLYPSWTLQHHYPDPEPKSQGLLLNPCFQWWSVYMWLKRCGKRRLFDPLCLKFGNVVFQNNSHSCSQSLDYYCFGSAGSNTELFFTGRVPEAMGNYLYPGDDCDCLLRGICTDDGGYR